LKKIYEANASIKCEIQKILRWYILYGFIFSVPLIFLVLRGHVFPVFEMAIRSIIGCILLFTFLYKRRIEKITNGFFINEKNRIAMMILAKVWCCLIGMQIGFSMVKIYSVWN
jgi:hypothetical protein